MDLGDRRLREEFAKVRNIAATGEACPEAAQIWDSAAEHLDHVENEKLIRHVAACGACAASWRLARELSNDGVMTKPQGRASRSWWIGLAAAAMIVLAVGTFALRQVSTTRPPEPVFRDWAGGSLVSEIPEDTVFPREDMVLRWSGAPPGTVYDLRVTDDRFRPLHRAFGLEPTECRLPAEALSGVPPGGDILWSVTAHLADGRRWTSLTFRATVE